MYRRQLSIVSINPQQPLSHPQPPLPLPPPIIIIPFFILQAADTMPRSGFYDGPLSAGPTYLGMAQPAATSTTASTSSTSGSKFGPSS